MTAAARVSVTVGPMTGTAADPCTAMGEEQDECAQ